MSWEAHRVHYFVFGKDRVNQKPTWAATSRPWLHPHVPLANDLGGAYRVSSWRWPAATQTGHQAHHWGRATEAPKCREHQNLEVNLNGLGPQYLADRLLPPRSTRITCHSQQGQLRDLTLGEAWKEKTRNRAFLAVAPRLWNALPTEIRLAPSLGVFKRQLKTWLFKQAFPPVS